MWKYVVTGRDVCIGIFDCYVDAVRSVQLTYPDMTMFAGEGRDENGVPVFVQFVGEGRPYLTVVKCRTSAAAHQL